MQIASRPSDLWKRDPAFALNFGEVVVSQKINQKINYPNQLIKFKEWKWLCFSYPWKEWLYDSKKITICLSWNLQPSVCASLVTYRFPNETLKNLNTPLKDNNSFENASHSTFWGCLVIVVSLFMTRLSFQPNNS